MPYVVTKASPVYREMSFEDMLFGDKFVQSYISDDPTNTVTRYYDQVPEKYLMNLNPRLKIEKLRMFCNTYDHLYHIDRRSMYNIYYRLKASGVGRRQISAPEGELRQALDVLKTILEYDFGADMLYHTSAFAYIKGRSTLDCVKRHQAADSKWFLKIDFHDFFGSTTKEFVMRMFSDIFPFSEIVKSNEGRELLSKALDLCFLDGGLPQGSPVSPLITNIMMIPIDHYLTNTLRDFDRRNFTSTRYADDMNISCKYNFEYQKITNLVNEATEKFGAPFKLNEEKTHYGSRSGSNYILGVVLNTDNVISVGFKNKKVFKAMVNSFIMDTINGTQWELGEIQYLAGKYSYYKSIEPEVIKGIISWFNEKYNVDFEQMIKEQQQINIAA